MLGNAESNQVGILQVAGMGLDRAALFDALQLFADHASYRVEEPTSTAKSSWILVLTTQGRSGTWHHRVQDMPVSARTTVYPTKPPLFVNRAHFEIFETHSSLITRSKWWATRSVSGLAKGFGCQYLSAANYRSKMDVWQCLLFGDLVLTR